MRLGIVIPTYNGAEFISRTIDSVLAQTRCPDSVVVVDDGSTDETPRILQKLREADERIQVLTQKNMRVSVARNRGLAALPADLDAVLFLDGDDVLYPRALEWLESALIDDPAAVAAHGMGHYIDCDGHPIRIGDLEARTLKRQAFIQGTMVAWPLDRPTTFEVVATDNCLTNGAVLIRRTALVEPQAFDPMCVLEYPGGEDWDLWIRLTTRGHFAFVPKVVLGYRRHTGNFSGRADLMFKGDVYVRRKAMRMPGLTRDQRALVRARYRAEVLPRVHAAASRARKRSGYLSKTAFEIAASGRALEACAIFGKAVAAYAMYLSIRLHYSFASCAQGRWVADWAKGIPYNMPLGVPCRRRMRNESKSLKELP